MSTPTTRPAIFQLPRDPPRLATLAANVLVIAMATGGSVPLASRPPAAAVERRLDRLLEARLGDPLPPRWQRRRVQAARDAASRIVADMDGPAIRFEAVAAATWFGLELSEPLTPSAGRLRWTWSVESGIAGADLRNASLDDSPARFIVVFGQARWLRPPRALFYSWGNHEPVDSSWLSRVSDRLGVYVLRGAADVRGAYVTEDRDLGADYHRVFGGVAPPVTAIGFMIDTDQTHARAVSRLGAVTWTSMPPLP